MLPLAIAILLIFVAGSLFVAASLGFLGAILANVYSSFPLMRGLGEITWSASADFTLVAVPMFIMMGELLLRSGVTDSMYNALDKWVGRIPGGLMHTNIAASAMFAATSGSSIATAATIGTVSIPNMTKFGYNPSLFLGTIAAGGTLGILIPPSINMVIYGALSETSVSDLYLAAIIPGVALAVLFSLFVLVICMIKPALAVKSARASWGEKFGSLVHLLPPLGLFLLVVGSIYAGIATPTEASALGVMGALGLALVARRLTPQTLLRAFENTVRTTAMVMLIVVMAFFLNFVLATVGLTDMATHAVVGLNLPPLVVMLLIIALYLVLGCFVETLTLMIATTPVIVPIIKHIGYSPIWFGVVFVILIEAALITPPIGMNLFVVQSVRGNGPLRDVIVGVMPFLIAMLVMIGFLLIWPSLALWLPAVFASNK
jgi:tripartite ATP-independent transporter DctM subunit